MSLHPGSTHRSHSTSRILASLSLFAVGMTFGTPSVSAGDSPDGNLAWGLDNVGGDCVQLLDKDVRIDTAAMPALVDPSDPDGPVELLFPTGTYTDGNPAVVDISWDASFIEASGGFYLMGFRFVENCDTWDAYPFEPCFSVSSTYLEPIEPWILSFVPGEYLLFFFNLEQIEATISIHVGLNESDCESDVVEYPEDGSSQIDELYDAIDDLDLVAPFKVLRRPSINFNIDHYLRRIAEQEASTLPDTL